LVYKADSKIAPHIPAQLGLFLNRNTQSFFLLFLFVNYNYTTKKYDCQHLFTKTFKQIKKASPFPGRPCQYPLTNFYFTTTSTSPTHAARPRPMMPLQVS
jgi:hypothetical protein